MDPDATADQTPLVALFRSSIAKRWKPLERNANFATIDQLHVHHMIVESHVFGEGLRGWEFMTQSVHAISLLARPGALAPVRE